MVCCGSGNKASAPQAQKKSKAEKTLLEQPTITTVEDVNKREVRAGAEVQEEVKHEEQALVSPAVPDVTHEEPAFQETRAVVPAAPELPYPIGEAKALNPPSPTDTVEASPAATSPAVRNESPTHLAPEVVEPYQEPHVQAQEEVSTSSRRQRRACCC